MDKAKPCDLKKAQKTPEEKQGKAGSSSSSILRFLRLYGALASLLVLSWVSDARAEMQPEAVGILTRMLKTYASVPAFACEGSCDDHEEGSSLPPDHRTVTMRFVRPDRFRLAWTQKDFHGKSHTSVIFTRHGQPFLREQGNDGDAEREPSLAQVISSCAGISLGLSYLVPALLLDDPGYLNFVSLRQEADANSGDGRPCWKLSGKTGEGAQWELLIDRETCALREAEEVNIVAPVTAQQVREAVAKDHAELANAPLPPPRAIRTLYRFTNIQFGGSWPDSVFAEPTPSGKKKR